MKPIDCIRSSKCGFRSPNDALTLKVETSLDLVIRAAPGGSGRELGPGGNCELLEHVAEVSVDGVG
jgi:hypothetical protein